MTNILISRRPSARAKVLYPSNQGMDKIAQTRLDQVVGQANKRHANALKVDGIQCHLFIREQGSLPCTCQGKKRFEDPQADPNVNFENPDPTTGKKSLDFDVYQIRGRSFGEEKVLTPDSLDDYESNHLAEEGFDSEDLQLEDSYNKLLTQIETEDLDPREAALFTGGDIQTKIFGGQKSRCGICFGSGWVDSYRYTSGVRYALDLSGKYEYLLESAELDYSTRPYSVIIEAGGWISFRLRLPKYFITCYGLSARNNLDALNLGVDLTYRTWGTNSALQALTKAALVALNGIGGELEIRITNKQTKPLNFTHLELFYQLSNLTYAQMPNINKSTTWEFFDALVQQNVEFGGDVNNLTRESVFLDSKWDQVWKITDVERLSTANRQTFGFNSQCRIVQNYESLYLFKIMSNPKLELNFKSLERVQGSQT